MDVSSRIDKLSATIAEAQQELEDLKNDAEADEEENNYDDDELFEMARHLGADMESIEEMSIAVRWVAEKALEAPLPSDWQEATNEAGDSYFYSTKLNKVSWDHPLDDSFRTMMAEALAGDAQFEESPEELETDGSQRSRARDEDFHKPGSSTLQDSSYSEETRAYAMHLGLDVEVDTELMWIAEQGVHAPVPSGWTEHHTPDGEVYYCHNTTKETSWAHPLDEHFKALAIQMKKEKAAMASPHGAEDVHYNHQDRDDPGSDDDERINYERGLESDNTSFDSEAASLHASDDDEWDSIGAMPGMDRLSKGAKSIKESMQVSINAAAASLGQAAAIITQSPLKSASPQYSSQQSGSPPQHTPNKSSSHKYLSAPSTPDPHQYADGLSTDHQSRGSGDEKEDNPDTVADEGPSNVGSGSHLSGSDSLYVTDDALKAPLPTQVNKDSQDPPSLLTTSGITLEMDLCL